MSGGQREIHKQFPLNIRSIKHPLAQGQLNENLTRSTIRVSLIKNNVRNPMKDANDFEFSECLVVRRDQPEEPKNL